MKKVICVGNLSKRTEIKGKKKTEGLAGSSYFAAVAAARMGYDTTIVTKASSNFPAKWKKDLDKDKIKLVTQPAWHDMEYSVRYYSDGNKTVKVIKDPGLIVTIPPMSCDVGLIGSYFGVVGVDVLKKLKTPDNIIALDSQGFIKYRNPSGEINYVPWLEKEKYLKYVDILKINANELYYLTGTKTINSAMNLLKFGPRVVTLTVGTEGSYVFYDKKYIKIPAYKTKLVDKASVGDVYMAAFAIRYKETEDIIDSAYFAAAAASYSIEKVGPKSIASLKKVEKRYKTLREIFLA